jgi:hypothetical protein
MLTFRFRRALSKTLVFESDSSGANFLISDISVAIQREAEMVALNLAA